MVVGVMPLLVFVAFAPMELQGLRSGPFDPLLSTAELPRLFSGAGMVILNILILVASLALEYVLFARAGSLKNVINATPM